MRLVTFWLGCFVTGGLAGVGFVVMPTDLASPLDLLAIVGASACLVMAGVGVIASEAMWQAVRA